MLGSSSGLLAEFCNKRYENEKVCCLNSNDRQAKNQNNQGFKVYIVNLRDFFRKHSHDRMI